MKNTLKGTFSYTLITSGIAYVITYVITTSNYSDVGAATSLAFGLGVYLAIRIMYKKDESFDKLSAKAYRLMIWLVPLLLLTAKLAFFFIEPDSKPQFIEFCSLDDLSWSGPLQSLRVGSLSL